MFDTIFEFKMMAKSFNKESNKAATQEKALLKKTKEAMERGDYEGAKVAAADAIRRKNDIKRYKVLSSKIETISQRLEAAYKNMTLTNSMKQLIEQMVGAAGTMDMVKINETMENFEKMFDNLDVNSEMMNQVFDNVNAGVTNETEVNQLLQQVADENNMQINEELGVGKDEIKTGQQQMDFNANQFP
jgi:charged multivesicular body protein 1